MILRAIIGVLVLGASSCREELAREAKYLDFDIIATNNIVGIPSDIILYEDSLLVNQSYGETFLCWFSIDNGKLLKNAIPKGDGKNEMIGPLKVSKFSDSLLIYDKPRFQLFKSDFRCDTLIPYADILPFWVTKVFPFDNGNLLVSKIPFGVKDKELASARFAIMAGDSILYHFGEYPNLSNSDNHSNPEILAQFHQVRGFTELPNSSFAVVTSHVLSIYEDSPEGYSLAKEIAIAPYEYDYEGSTSTHSAITTLKTGYSPGTTVGLVYYDGKIYLPFQETEQDGIVILEYDLNLNLISTIRPTMSIDAPFTIDKTGHIISLKEDKNETKICISKAPISEI
ncbi:MAG: TolB-like 6-bladed beta-propeller domain-containing protein [Clostridium sp.]|nr:TolB-like 6-bladed beta-propeller domain-containing protein [Clostridium sp.]